MADDGSKEILNMTTAVAGAAASAAAILLMYAASKIKDLELKSGEGEVSFKNLIKSLGKKETLNYREFTAEEYELIKKSYITDRCGVRNYSCMNGADGKVMLFYGSDDIGAMDNVQQAVEAATNMRSEISNKAFTALASDQKMVTFSGLTEAEVENLRKIVPQLNNVPYTVVKNNGEYTVICCEEDKETIRQNIALLGDIEPNKKLFSNGHDIVNEDVTVHNKNVRIKNREKLFNCREEKTFVDLQNPGDRIEVFKDRFVVYMHGKEMGFLERGKDDSNMQLAYGVLEKMENPAIIRIEDFRKYSKEELEEHTELVQELETEYPVYIDRSKLEEKKDRNPEKSRQRMEKIKIKATPFYPPLEEKEGKYMPEQKINREEIVNEAR